MQRDSTKLRTVEQLQLIPDRKIVSRPVSLEHIYTLKSTAQALDYACHLADVVPKEICPQMDCDKTTWSRICSGKWDLDGRDVPKLSRVLNNDAYLLYLNHECGFDLASMRKVATNTLERENAELRAENEDYRRAFRLMVEAQKGKT